MKYYKELLRKKVFHKSDIDDLTQNSNTSKSFLQQAIKKNLIKRIKHDYYAVISLETDSVLPDRFMIASNICHDSFISHHTAFEYYGYGNQVYEMAFTSSFKKFKEFDFEGIIYECVPEKYDFGVVEKNRVRVTDMERTLLDNIKGIDKYIELEELLQCIDLVMAVDENILLDYLSKYDNIFLYQKAGYILSHFDDLKLSQRFFDVCKSKIGKSVRYLYHGIKYDNPIYDSYWQLYVPKNLLYYSDWKDIYV